MLMLTTIANFIIRSSIVAPDQSSLKTDTHDETFVCNLCMQLLCVPYTTVQTMKLLYATSHYLLLFPAKIMHTFSTWCLLSMLRRAKLLSHFV